MRVWLSKMLSLKDYKNPDAYAKKRLRRAVFFNSSGKKALSVAAMLSITL